MPFAQQTWKLPEVGWDDDEDDCYYDYDYEDEYVIERSLFGEGIRCCVSLERGIKAWMVPCV